MRDPAQTISACMLSHVQFFCDPLDCSLPGSSVLGILQARILGWVAMPSSRGSSPHRDQTCISCISCIGRWILYHWCQVGKAGREAAKVQRRSRQGCAQQGIPEGKEEQCAATGQSLGKEPSGKSNSSPGLPRDGLDPFPASQSPLQATYLRQLQRMEVLEGDQV